MRKIIMLVVGAIAAVIGFVLPAIGVTNSNLPGAISALGIVLAYVFIEAKADMRNILAKVKQEGKLTDPVFWVGLISAILVYLSAQFGWNLPLEIITPVLIVVL